MRLDLTLGTQIACTDQSSGKLVEIVVDPATKQVTDLVVQKGLLTKQAWVVPLAAVERVTGHAIQLNFHSDELNTYPEYHAADVSEPAAGGPQTPGAALSPALGVTAEPPAPMVRKRLREGLVTGRTVLSAQTAVRTQQGDEGSLEHVLIDAESGQIAQLVIRKGFFPKSFMIPHEVIAQISADAILLTLRSEELAALPPMQRRRDDEVLAEIQQRLQEGWPAFTGVMATCEAGRIRLIGYVRSKPHWYHAAELAQLVAGVTDVQNDLIVDPDFVPDDGGTTVDLARQVHHAFIADARTATAVIDVISDRDTIILQGTVDSEEIRRSAEEIALQQPNVSAVDNRLAITQVGTAPKLNYG